MHRERESSVDQIQDIDSSICGCAARRGLLQIRRPRGDRHDSRPEGSDTRASRSRAALRQRALHRRRIRLDRDGSQAARAEIQQGIEASGAADSVHDAAVSTGYVVARASRFRPGSRVAARAVRRNSGKPAHVSAYLFSISIFHFPFFICRYLLVMTGI